MGPPIPVGGANGSAATGDFEPSGNGPKSVSGGRQNVDMMPLIQLITTSIAPGTWKVHDPNGTAEAADGYGLGQAAGAGFGLDAGVAAGGLNEQPIPPGSITP